MISPRDLATQIKKYIFSADGMNLVTHFAICQCPNFSSVDGKYWIGFDIDGVSYSIYGPIRGGMISRYTIAENNSKSTAIAVRGKLAGGYEVISSIDHYGAIDQARENLKIWNKTPVAEILKNIAS